MLRGLLTALHLRLQHPSKSQLLQVFRRSFFALDAEPAINEVTTSCPQCSANDHTDLDESGLSSDEEDCMQPHLLEIPERRLIPDPPADIGRPRREHRPPGYLRDYVLDLDTIDDA